MYCTKCGAKSDETSNFCMECGTPLQGTRSPGTEQRPSEGQERVLLIVPKCHRDKFARGTHFYNLLITDRRIVCGRTGGTGLLRTSGLAGAVVLKIAKDRQDVEKFSGMDLDEIVNLSRDNFAVPFVGFEQIGIFKRLGQPYVTFKLNSEGKRFDPNSAVPRFLSFDRQYFEPLQTTLKSLAGTILKT